MQRSRFAAFAALGGLSLVSVAPSARAQSASDLTRARESFKQALDDEAAGQYEKAAREFDQARTLAQKETPQVLFHLGTCHSRMGRLVAAKSELAAAVERANAEGLGNVATTAKAELDRVSPRIASVTVQKPAHGSVTSMTLDRADATAKVGTSIEVDPGAHDVHVETSDGPPADMHVTLADGEHKDVTIGGAASQTAPTPVPGPTPASTPSTTPATATGGTDATPTPDTTSPSTGGSSTLGWILVGGGAAAVAGGAIFWVLRGNEDSTLHGECGPTGKTCPASAQGDINSGKLDDTLGVTLFAVGGAALLGGAGWLLFGPHGGAAPATGLTVSPYVTAHGGGIGLQGVTW